MNKINMPISKNIAERLREIDQLTHLMEIILKTSLEGQVWPLLKYNQLILLTNNTQLANSARFMQRDICYQVSQTLNRPVKKLTVKMINIEPIQSRMRYIKREVSSSTAELVYSIAAHIEDDVLSQTLCRLMKNYSDQKTG